MLDTQSDTSDTSARTTATVFIALGANLGKPLQQLNSACGELNKHSKIQCIARSPIYKSVPHGDIEQPDYYNAVLHIETQLEPCELLRVMQRIELEHGRERIVHWGARTLDLDLILYDDVVMETEFLTLPHPYAHKREFVVKPLYDLNPDITIPNYGIIKDILPTLPLHNLAEVENGTTYHKQTKNN